MDYMLTVTYEGGKQMIPCATNTDVENQMISHLRAAIHDAGTIKINFKVVRA